MLKQQGSDDQLPADARQRINDFLAAVQRRLDAEQRRVEAQPLFDETGTSN